MPESPFAQMKEKEEEARAQAGAPIGAGLAQEKRTEYESSLLFKFTHAPTPEQAAEALKGELVRFVDKLREYWGRIVGYHAALIVEVQPYPPLPFVEKHYVPPSAVKEIKLGSQKQQEELANLVAEAKASMDELEKTRKGVPLHYQEITAYAEKPIAFVERKENGKLLLRLVIGAGSSMKEYSSAAPVKKFAIIVRALKILGGT